MFIQLNKPVRTAICIVALIFLSLLNTDAQDNGGAGDNLDYLITLHEKNPEVVGYIVPIAQYYKKREMFNTSIEWLMKAADIQPENTDILFEIGLLLSWTDQHAHAIEHFDRILSMVPDHDDAKLAKARVLSWQDKRSEALSLCDEVISSNPDYIDAYELKARILIWEKKYDEAIEVYTLILTIKPDNKNARMGLAEIISFQGNYEEAVLQFKNLLTQYPGDIALMNALGKVLLWQGEYEEGISVLKKSFAFDERRKETAELLSRAYLWSKRFEEGIEFQTGIIKKEKDNFQAVYNIAVLYEAMEKYEEAIKWYEKARDLKKDDPQVNAKLGLLYSRTRKIDQAISSLQRSLKIRENDVENLINLGRVYSWQLRIKESIALYRRALEIDPLNEDAYIGLGRTYFYDGQWDLAKEQFSKALEINPLNKEAFSQIARLRRLMRPSFITSYRYAAYRDYARNSGDLSGKTVRHEVWQTLNHNFSSQLLSEIQYRRIHEKSYEYGDRLYSIKANEYSLYVNSKLNKSLQLRGKLIAGDYKADSDFFTLQNSDLISGFIFLDYIKDKWELNAGFIREPLFPIYRGDELWIEHTDSYGTSLRYHQSEYLSLFTSFYYKKDYSDYKRNDYWLGFDYVLPQFTKIKFEYYFRQITNPQDNLLSGTIIYTDNIDKLTFFASYNLETSSFFDEVTQIIEVFFYYNLKDYLSANAGLTYGRNLKEDKDETVELNAYVSYRF